MEGFAGLPAVSRDRGVHRVTFASSVYAMGVPDRGDTMTLVLVDTDAGLSGLGEVGIHTHQEAVRGALAHLADVLDGQDATRIEQLWQVMSRSRFFPADRFLNAAVAAVDVALWDIKGKALGVPVYRLLGGKVREWVPCYAHVPGEDGSVPRRSHDATTRNR